MYAVCACLQFASSLHTYAQLAAADRHALRVPPPCASSPAFVRTALPLRDAREGGGAVVVLFQQNVGGFVTRRTIQPPDGGLALGTPNSGVTRLLTRFRLRYLQVYIRREGGRAAPLPRPRRRGGCGGKLPLFLNLAPPPPPPPPRLLGSRTVGGEDGDLCPSLCSSLGELPASVARLRTERGRGLDGGGDDVTDWMRPCRIKVIDIGYVQSVPAGGLDGWTGNRVHCAVGYGAESLSSSRWGMPLRPLEIHPFGVRVPRHRHPICR